MSLTMPPKGSIRKRHLANLVDQEATGAPEADEVVSGTVSALAVGPRGGIRQRFEASPSSSSAAPAQPRVESVREKKAKG